MRGYLRLLLLVVTVFLTASAAAVEPEVASAYVGPNPVETGLKTAPYVDWDEVFECVLKPQTCGGNSGGWTKLRTKLAWPPRFPTGAVVGIGGAVTGGYVAWKICDSIYTTNCDFLGLRDTIGEWGDPSVRTTFTTASYQWKRESDTYWYLQPSSGPVNQYGNQYVIEKTFDSGATWIRHAASGGDCPSDTAIPCNNANTERWDVFNVATRGDLHYITRSPTTTRTVSRRLTDADMVQAIRDSTTYYDGQPGAANGPSTADYPTTTVTSSGTKPGAVAEGESAPESDPDSDSERPDLAEAFDEDLTPTERTEVGQDFDPEWEGPGFNMPDCVGVSETTCDGLLDALGHTGVRTYVELDFEGAVVTQPAGAIITQATGAGVELMLDAELEFERNPDVETMPLLLPEPLPGETYAAWLVRLQALGYVGTVTLVTLSEELGVPELGPSAPVTLRIPTIETVPGRTVGLPGGWPTPSPRVKPDTDIDVWNNPATYPPVDPSTVPPPTGGVPGGVPDVDFTPITDIDFGCKFPYGFICLAQEVTGWFDVSPVAPVFTFDISGVTTSVGSWDCACEYEVDLSNMDDYMGLLRTLMSVAMWIGAVYWLAVKLLGFNAGGDPGEAVDEGLDWQ